MERFKLSIFLLAIIPFFLASCEKSGTGTVKQTGKDVEVYLLKSYTLTEGKQIDESSVELNSEPLICYSDIISYNMGDYQFTLTKDAKKTISNRTWSTNGVAFGITVDKELVYTGYFWPSYSSATCDWIVTDPFIAGNNGKLIIEIGYPYLIGGDVVQDKRNDSRIISVLRRDGKLN